MDFKIKLQFEVNTYDVEDDSECDRLYHETKKVIQELDDLIEQKLRERLPICYYNFDTM